MESVRALWDRVRERVHLGHAAILIMVVTFIGFLRARQLVAGQESATANDDVRLGLFLMVGMFSLVVICLSIALWHWGSLWALEQAGTLRMRQLFEAVNSLQDGLLAVDREGRILGGNQQARRLAGRPLGPGRLLPEVVPFLQPEHLERLLDPTRPQEVVIAAEATPGEEGAFRIRSFPARGMSLLLVSDVTAEEEAAISRGQQAQLETIGRIAQGVAHDFNNILCAISAHAALLGRPDLGADAVGESLATIGDEANRGAILARQLVDLSRPVEQSEPEESLRETVCRAVAALRTILPGGWEVVAREGEERMMPAMPARQLEQLLVRFSLQLAEEHEDPGTLNLVVDPVVTEADEAPDDAPGLVHLLVTRPGRDPAPEALVPDPTPPLSRDGGGVIQSVALSLLERYGGGLDVMVDASGFHGFRVHLVPASLARHPGRELGPRPVDLGGWRVLLARPAIGMESETQQLLRELGAEVVRVNNVVAAYSQLGDGPIFRAVFIDEVLLGVSPGASLARLLRLQPQAAVVLLRDAGGPEYPMAEEVAPLVRPVSRHGIRVALLHAVQMAHDRTEPRGGKDRGRPMV